MLLPVAGCQFGLRLIVLAYFDAAVTAVVVFRLLLPCGFEK